VNLARRYLGDLSTPPLDRFVAGVDATLELVRSTRPARVLPVTEESVVPDAASSEVAS